MNIAIDDSPLQSGHSLRGIGAYTRLLLAELPKLTSVTLVPWSNRSQADVWHYPYFDLFFNTLPVRNLHKTILTIHDVIPLLFPDHYKVGWKGKVRLWFQKWKARRVLAIITDSERSKHDIVTQLKISSDKIFVVPLAPSAQLNPVSSDEVKRVARRLRLPKRYCLYVGDINYNKNIPQLIKMLKYLPWNIKLVCVGSNFRSQNIPEWKVIVTQLALSDVEQRVMFLPTIASNHFSTLAAVYTGALCYVQPSLYEGFGLPILEAMRCRTPVVATKVASHPEVGGEYVLYAQPTAESLAQSVEAVLGWSHTKRSAWLRDASQWANQFSAQKTAEETAAVYAKVLR